jgi:4-amino-4-deoxy-L-arabinose transferase-like glycosyltransferase
VSKHTLKLAEKIILALLLALAAYIVFYNLGGFPLENWDEAWYGDIIRNMLRQKDFIVLHWNRMPLIDKPPFFMWIGAALSSIIGLSEFSIRLPSALSALAAIAIVTIYSYRQYGFVPSLLAFSAIAFNNVFIWRARTGNIDALVSLQIFLTYFLILSKNKFRYLLLGILFAMIYLTKASLVFFPLVIFALHELFFEIRNFKKNFFSYLMLLVVFVSLSGVWLLLGSLKEGSRFAQYYLFHSDQGAANIDLSDFSPNYLKYAYYSLQRRFFWVLLFGLFMALIKIKEAKYFLLALFSSLLLIVISFGKKDNNWYLAPLMPFWAILIAFGTHQFINIFKNFRKTKYLAIAGVLVASLYVSYKTYTINIRSVMASQTTAAQARICSMLGKLTESSDRVVRLDHLYPTTIYYSDRFVYSSNPSAGTDRFFLSKEDLLKRVLKGELKWIVGKTSDIDEFTKKLPPGSWKIVATEGDEQILFTGVLPE